MPKTEPELVTISEAARRAEVSRSTVQRQIQRGELVRDPSGRVDVHAVIRLSCRRGGPGRPCGVTLAERGHARSEVESLAAPFLSSGVRGLYRLEQVLRFTLLHYLAAGRGETAAAVIGEAAKLLPTLRERHGAGWRPPADWRQPWHWTSKRQRRVSPAEQHERREKQRAGMTWMLAELQARRSPAA